MSSRMEGVPNYQPVSSHSTNRCTATLPDLSCLLAAACCLPACTCDQPADTTPLPLPGGRVSWPVISAVLECPARGSSPAAAVIHWWLSAPARGQPGLVLSRLSSPGRQLRRGLQSGVDIALEAVVIQAFLDKCVGRDRTAAGLTGWLVGWLACVGRVC